MVKDDLKWFSTANLKEFKGEYIIILDKEIVFHGKNLKEMVNKFRKKYPNKIPKIAKVPEEELLIFFFE